MDDDLTPESVDGDPYDRPQEEGRQDLVPFFFQGFPNTMVYLHPCGTVVDVNRGTEMWDEVQAGDCDCESGASWMRIYVTRDALAKAHRGS